LLIMNVLAVGKGGLEPRRQVAEGVLFIVARSG